MHFLKLPISLPQAFFPLYASSAAGGKIGQSKYAYAIALTMSK